MSSKYQAGRIAGICEVAEKISEGGLQPAMALIVNELLQHNMTRDEIEGEYPRLLLMAGMDCPFDFSHTKDWCGHEGCRDA